ncbi:hypothetical protein K438DRAFT_1987532 [Mycena galopus ATCC 62051]|nr:hypothetical protein K438DRAFT_1987532 [Mycena galopus ATCC 62051]
MSLRPNFQFQRLPLGMERCRGRPGRPAIATSPPPIVCGPGTYLWGNTCKPQVGTCTTAPATQVFAHPEMPCGCQQPGALYDAKKTVCDTPPANAKMYCETATNGRSSECKVQCDPGWKYNPKEAKCIRDNLEGCKPPLELASGPPNKGCLCLKPEDPNVSFKGQKCGEVPYNSQEDEDAGLDPPGRMVCIIDPKDISNSLCQAQCTAAYKLQGQAMCVPKGL